MSVHRLIPERRLVAFSVTDGFRPERGPDGNFDMLAPIPVALHPGVRTRIDLGISCDLPVQFFDGGGMAARGVVLDAESRVIRDRGSPLSVALVNTSRDVVNVMPRESLVRAFVLDNRDLVERA